MLNSQRLCALVAVTELPWVTAQILEGRPRVAHLSVFSEPAGIRWVLGWPLMAWPPFHLASHWGDRIDIHSGAVTISSTYAHTVSWNCFHSSSVIRSTVKIVRYASNVNSSANE
jgi:hypothetical protein